MKKKLFLLCLPALLHLLEGGILFAGGAKIAVMDFKTIGDNSNLGEGAAEILRTTLAGTGEYTIVERGMLKQVLKEQKLGQSGILDPKTAVGIGKVLGAKFVAVGSVVKFGKSYTLNVRFVNVETGEVLEGKRLTAGSKEEIPGLCLQMVKLLSGDTKSKFKKKKAAIKKPRKQVILRNNFGPVNKEWSFGILYPGVALKREINNHAWELKVQPGSGIFVGGARYYRYLKKTSIKIFWGFETDYISFKGEESKGAGFAFGGFAGGEIPITRNIGLSADIGPMHINLSDSDYSQTAGGLEYILNMTVYWHFK